MTPREKLTVEIAEWLESAGVFDAPYGILTGKSHNHRTITFGKRRSLDATIKVYSANFIILTDSRFYTEKLESVEALKAVLKERYLT